ncbi:hypothetical protein B484DRAFT_407107 [Ochromonadaceae sp. CCMP2298]|nr:hypothetical protein B484DRAFT_407107 [Ochromonadaceae sp. CCMP2298]
MARRRWYDDDSDTELLKLIGFLKTLQGVDDVRPIGAYYHNDNGVPIESW